MCWLAKRRVLGKISSHCLLISVVDSQEESDHTYSGTNDDVLVLTISDGIGQNCGFEKRFWRANRLSESCQIQQYNSRLLAYEFCILRLAYISVIWGTSVATSAMVGFTKKRHLFIRKGHA